jgi:predicted ferric reductase
MLFALGAYGWLAINNQLPGAGWMAAGVLVTLIAAGVQALWKGQARPLTFIWQFDQNGLYHLIQMVGVVLLLVGLRIGLLS